MIPNLPLTVFPVATLAPGIETPVALLLAAAAVVVWGLGGLIALELLRDRPSETESPRVTLRPTDGPSLRRAA